MNWVFACLFSSVIRLFVVSRIWVLVSLTKLLLDTMLNCGRFLWGIRDADQFSSLNIVPFAEWVSGWGVGHQGKARDYFIFRFSVQYNYINERQQPVALHRQQQFRAVVCVNWHEGYSRDCHQDIGFMQLLVYWHCVEIIPRIPVHRALSQSFRFLRRQRASGNAAWAILEIYMLTTQFCLRLEHDALHWLHQTNIVTEVHV